ncbi:glycosyltransferase [Hymenobacter arizonensis]|uniref:Glycosyltransferase involved in cell wall bisynthesis n=1 Tax=Hymenobacter arizonensis TaxID=1227077 RepID=A0A1I6BRW3_HYMAR|nr:glycosyltransferase [Hymenobacter arizonensis]SFQ83597.1 Glycosyltransferase involved in cell wall bisynthesis [Hymenobacter arizonensis]
MKIAFLCGSLEPGRDGVGDYVQRLAAELLHQGLEVTAIALKDQHATQENLHNQQVAGSTFPILRLPATWSSNRRYKRARQWIVEFDPDWLSLQFVPFSFHSKGLPFGLPRQLARLGKGRAWHLMLHELWVGMDVAASRKHILWGMVQRQLIKSLIACIGPKIIHTQTLLYQAQLAKVGFCSHYLPLFSNIAVPSNRPKRAIAQQFDSNVSTEATIRLVLFGTIHPGAPVTQFARDAARYAQQHTVSITLTLVGRCGSEQDHWAASWQEVGLPIEILGEQTPNQISHVLLNASLGIVTTPAWLIGKSGTAAAMQEHELPILCVAPPWFPRGIDTLTLPKGVKIYEEGNFSDYLFKRVNPNSIHNVSVIASQLVNALLKNI